MAQNRYQRIQAALEELVDGTPDIKGAALVSDDGLVIGSVLHADVNEDSVGGMASVLQSLGFRVTNELELGEMDQILIRAKQGNVMMVGVGEGALLSVLMSRNAKLGLVFLDVGYAVKNLAEMI
ncbi:MAG: roadblock/LC7 domain-containing protein [Myxococcota bacterium]|nr:roadblock/LC7 domain-containing protein [Myxococcota bacterium]